MANYKYSKRITVGRDAEGKTIRKRIYGNSKAELDRNEYALRKESESYSGVSDMSFHEYSEKWFLTYKSQKEVRTQDYYRRGIKKFDSFDYRSMRSITKSDIQLVINQNWNHPRTCIMMRQVIKSIFESAIADGICIRNPAANLQVPKYKRTEKRPLTEIEVEAIKSVVLEPMEAMAVKIMYCFGLRPEELRGLEVSDFNLSEQTLTISRAVTFRDNSAVIKGTKTGKIRTIPVPDSIVDDLAAYFATLPNSYLFTMRDLSVMSKSSWFKFSKRVFGKINLALGGSDKDDRLNGMTWYTFRHNVGTRWYYLSGISAKKKAEMMGHSEKMFMEIYSHVDESKEDLSALKNFKI